MRMFTPFDNPIEEAGRMCRYRTTLTWKHSVALIVQIHLQQNRADLAAKEAQRARKWAQDSLLVNIAESWVGMREVHFPTPLFPFS